MSFVSISEKNDHFIKRFNCTFLISSSDHKETYRCTCVFFSAESYVKKYIIEKYDIVLDLLSGYDEIGLLMATMWFALFCSNRRTCLSGSERRHLERTLKTDIVDDLKGSFLLMISFEKRSMQVWCLRLLVSFYLAVLVLYNKRFRGHTITYSRYAWCSLDNIVE